MTTLTIKNIPIELYQNLKDRAMRHRRSLNSEVIFKLEESVIRDRLNPEAFLDKVRAVRLKMPKFHITNAKLTQIKNKGRP